MALGIALILVGAAFFVVFIIWGANDPATIDIAGLRADTSALVVFVIGAIAAALIFVGMRMLLNGIRRDVRRMRKTRDLKQQAERATRAAEEATRAAEKQAEADSKAQAERQAAPANDNDPPKPTQT